MPKLIVLRVNPYIVGHQRNIPSVCVNMSMKQKRTARNLGLSTRLKEKQLLLRNHDKLAQPRVWTEFILLSGLKILSEELKCYVADNTSGNRKKHKFYFGGTQFYTGLTITAKNRVSKR